MFKRSLIGIVALAMLPALAASCGGSESVVPVNDTSSAAYRDGVSTVERSAYFLMRGYPANCDGWARKNWTDPKDITAFVRGCNDELKTVEKARNSP